MKREYVLVSIKWCRNKDYLIFWGTETADNAPKRSYSGYTMDLDGCEKYTKEELEKERHLFWDGKTPAYKLIQDESYAVKITDLHHFGRKMTIIYK